MEWAVNQIGIDHIACLSVCLLERAAVGKNGEKDLLLLMKSITQSGPPATQSALTGIHTNSVNINLTVIVF